MTINRIEVAIHWRRYPEEVPPLDAGTLLFVGPESDHPIEDRQDPHLGDYREAEDWGEGNEGFYCQRPECDCLVPGVRLWVPASEMAPREGR